MDKETLENFFSTPQEESATVEFKSGGVSLEDIHREVAAFLNTEGGLLIIGAPRETEIAAQNGKKQKVCAGALTASNISNQETLLRSIASNIAPGPIGIKAATFPHLTGFVFVLEIPQSFTPPHQVSNEGRYYIRLDREAKAAPHGIVEALFQKRQRPNLEANITVSTKFNFPDSHFVGFEIRNDSVVSAEAIGYMLEIRGARNVKSTHNVNEDYELTDETLKVQSFFKEQILVRGISMMCRS